MKIGVFGAEEQEISLLKEKLNTTSSNISGLTFYEGSITDNKGKEKQIVLVCSGIGKVNAALCTQILISWFKVDSVINTGVAGALLNDLNVFDIVVSTDSVQHDVDATAFGYKKGQLPMNPSPFWIADTTLRETAINSFKKLQQNDKEGAFSKIKIIEGTVASGDVFVCTPHLRNSIIQEFNPCCVEMEGAAAAQVCVINRIPYLILRSMSDTAGKAGEAKMSYEFFSAQAAKNSSLLVLEILKSL